MSDIAIDIQGISKRYRIGQEKKNSLRESMTHFFRNSNNIKETKEFWALQEISLQIKKGEAVGIIGKNGAGKSTLLKILSRITEPSSGKAIINGRVSSLLEVGTGFHPELTGKENIYLNGTILGMSRKEVKSKLDEIVEFSGVEKFLFTPVKHYSSGMYVRLAFSVAAHLEPEILIIDEVLAVGDLEFQKKCIGKMGDIANEGRTVIFVSHNMDAIRKLTNNCIHLENGQLLANGLTQEVVRNYLLSSSLGNKISTHGINSSSPAFLSKVKILTSEANNLQKWGKPLSFEFSFQVQEVSPSTCFAFQIVDSNMNNVAYYWLYASYYDLGKTVGTKKLRCTIENCQLFEGDYFLKTWLTQKSGNQLLDAQEGLLNFRVEINDIIHEEYSWKKSDCYYLDRCTWSTDEGNHIAIPMTTRRQT